MAGVTSHRLLAVEAALVQIKDHLDHLTSSQLGGLIVFIEAVGGVAVVATHTKRAGDEGHGWVQLRGRKCFEDLDVLVFLLRGLGVHRRNNNEDENERE